MPRITSEKSYSAGPRRERSSFSSKKLITMILVPVLVLASAALVYAKRDSIKSFVIGLRDDETVQPRETNDATTDPSHPDTLEELGQTDIPSAQNIPPSEAPSPEVTPQLLHEAVKNAYTAPIVHTKGTINTGEKKVAFDTVWTPDHVSGSGSLTYNGKQTQTYLVEKMILIHNQDGIVGDLIGKPVPMQQWIIFNANDDLSNIYPTSSLLDGIAQGEIVKTEDPNFSTKEFIVTLNPEKTAAIGVGTPKGNWSIQPGSGDQVQAPGPEIQIEGKVEKTPDGQWKVFRFAQ